MGQHTSPLVELSLTALLAHSHAPLLVATFALGVLLAGGDHQLSPALTNSPRACLAPLCIRMPSSVLQYCILQPRASRAARCLRTSLVVPTDQQERERGRGRKRVETSTLGSKHNDTSMDPNIHFDQNLGEPLVIMKNTND